MDIKKFDFKRILIVEFILTTLVFCWLVLSMNVKIENMFFSDSYSTTMEHWQIQNEFGKWTDVEFSGSREFIEISGPTKLRCQLPKFWNGQALVLKNQNTILEASVGDTLLYDNENLNRGMLFGISWAIIEIPSDTDAGSWINIETSGDRVTYIKDCFFGGKFDITSYIFQNSLVCLCCSVILFILIGFQLVYVFCFDGKENRKSGIYLTLFIFFSIAWMYSDSMFMALFFNDPYIQMYMIVLSLSLMITTFVLYLREYFVWGRKLVDIFLFCNIVPYILIALNVFLKIVDPSHLLIITHLQILSLGVICIFLLYKNKANVKMKAIIPGVIILSVFATISISGYYITVLTTNRVNVELFGIIYSLGIISFCVILATSNYRLTMKELKTVKDSEVYKKMAYTDFLTNVGNVASYNQRSESLEFNNSNYSIIMFDLNNLKVTNDTSGHNSGDRLIITLADCLAKVFGKENIYRIGGDEFVVVDSEKEKRVLEKLEKFNNLVEFNNLGNNVVHVSVAYGYAIRTGTGNVLSIRKKAEEKMYENKKTYKD